jgi:hypothetical protein
MKLKLTILLTIVSVGLISGEVCNGQPFKGIKIKNSFFDLIDTYFYGDNIDGRITRFSQLDQLPITSLRPDMMTLEFGDNELKEEIKLPIFSPNLVCNEVGTKIVCLLEFVTIVSNLFVFKQIRFHYYHNTQNVDDPSCEKILRDTLGLNENKRNFCRVENIMVLEHIFYIVLPDTKQIRFNAQENEFMYDNRFFKPKQIDITINKEGAILNIENNEYNFGVDTSCFSLLKKIKSLFKPETCSAETNEFSYHYLTKNGELLTKESDIQSEGIMNLEDLTNIKINNQSGFQFKRFEEAYLLPTYDKKYLHFYLDNNDDHYEAYVYLRTDKCFERIKEKLLALHSCTYDKYSLVYYNQKNNFPFYYRKVQNTEEVLVEKVLVFDFRKGEVDDRGILQYITIYDMKLKQNEKGKDRLYVNGVNRKGELVNITYSVRINIDPTCKGKFVDIQNKLTDGYLKMADQGKFYFWQLDKKNEQKSFAEVELKKNKVTIVGEESLIQSAVVENNSLKLKIDENEIIYHSNCARCLEILSNKLNKVVEREKKRAEKPIICSSKIVANKKINNREIKAVSITQPKIDNNADIDNKSKKEKGSREKEEEKEATTHSKGKDRNTKNTNITIQAIEMDIDPKKVEKSGETKRIFFKLSKLKRFKRGFELI